MERALINQEVSHLRSQVDEIVKTLHDRSLKISNEQLTRTISELRQRIHDPFMFVIVGEVKAGKSSFVNALLGVKEEVCKVAPQPMTDTIQQIMYGAEPSETIINPYLKRIYQPVEILKEIAIVDTPGTNTIIDHHQEITENFIPAADLIVFVFESKNPYRQSSWEFFDYINEEWRKKIIFILQQKDLMEPDDLVVNTNGVLEYAEKKGIKDANVFAVSAKEEQQDKPESGFKAVRAYISKEITGGRAPFLKIKNNLAICSNINDRIRNGLELRKRQYEQDIKFRANIGDLLIEEQERNVKKVAHMVDHLLKTYDSVTNKTDRDLVDGLSFGKVVKRTFSSFFDKKNGTKQWFENLTKELENNLNLSLQDGMQQGIDEISGGIQNMATKVGDQIQSSDTILKNDHEFFSAIAEKRANILLELREEFDAFMKDSKNFYDKEVLPNNTNVGSNLAAGSGIAIIGMVLTAVTNVNFIDITGGILTAVGVLFAGITIGVNRQKVIKNYRIVIQNGRDKLEKELTDKLTTYINNIKGKIEQLFNKFDQHLEDEKAHLNEAFSADEQTKKGIKDCETSIEKLLEQL